MADAASEVRSAPPNTAKPSRWVPLIVSTLAVVVVAGVAYYGMQYLRTSTFSDERAFRVLREMIGQFGNFQATVAGMGSLVEASKGKSRLEGVALQGEWPLEFVSCPKDGSGNANASFEIDLSSASRTFSMTMGCPRPLPGKANRDALTARLSDSLSRQLPVFVSQQFFETVVLASSDGAILARIPLRDARRSGKQWAEAGTEHLVFANAGDLLQSAMSGRSESSTPGTPSKAQTSDAKDIAQYPVVHGATIAGESFRIFVQPFEPAYPVVTGAQRVRQSHLYLVGVKRQDTLRSLLDSMGASGTLFITLTALLVVLAWPLASLRFSAPQEPIGATQVFAAAISLLLIPAVIAVACFSIWSHHRLVLWADQAAEIYARDVESTLLVELSAGARTLDDLAAQYAGRLDIIRDNFVMDGDSSYVRKRRENGLPVADPPACMEPSSCDFQFRRPESSDESLAAQWSTMRVVAPLNLQGRSAGLTLNMFGGDAPQMLELPDREYFKAILQGEEWNPGELWSQAAVRQSHLPVHGVFAQRLFNRSDGARVLQIAVPIHERIVPRSGQSRRLGVLTADTQAYGLTASVRPPLLRFAVIESDSGVVLFHSDDSRSLAENLLVETERNQSLREAMYKRASRYSLGAIGLQDHFTGRYLGQAHHFHYRPIAGVPWGIVIFYPSEGIADSVLQTAVATLATTFVFAALGVFVLTVIIVLLPGRPDLDLLALVWPRWEWRERYRALAPCVAIAALAAALLVVVHLRSNVAAAVLVIAIAVATGGVITAVWSRMRRPGRSIDVRSYEKHYVCCLTGAICMLCVAPVIWLACDYHDTSVAALIRDELRQSADDANARQQLIARDLGRLTRLDVATRMQNARVLSGALPVPGFRVVSARNRTQQWQLTFAQPGLWLSRCGPPAIGPLRRTIWTFSTSQQAQRPRGNAAENVAAERPDDRREIRARSGGADEVCAEDRPAVRYMHRGEDGQRTRMGLPLRNPDARSYLRPDPELAARYAWSHWLLLLLMAAIFMMILTALCWHAARRLFGIRIPFAGRFTPREAKCFELGPLVDAELDLLALKKKHGAEFTSKDEADWRMVHCRKLYAAAWQAVDRPQERLLLHELARGYFANPENRPVIESLLRRNYLKLWPWPRIVEAGFADYIRTQDHHQELAQLHQEASQHLWHRIRTPLLIVIVIVAGQMMWLAGSAMQILSATLAGIGALFTSITQLTSFGRKDGK